MIQLDTPNNNGEPTGTHARGDLNPVKGDQSIRERAVSKKKKEKEKTKNKQQPGSRKRRCCDEWMTSRNHSTALEESERAVSLSLSLSLSLYLSICLFLWESLGAHLGATLARMGNQMWPDESVIANDFLRPVHSPISYRWKLGNTLGKKLIRPPLPPSDTQ